MNINKIHRITNSIKRISSSHSVLVVKLMDKYKAVLSYIFAKINDVKKNSQKGQSFIYLKFLKFQI
ncbi:hypothetical protein BpHYR1_032987 [Brachionus plicatilis]|uniref:Uncharacterized protein n=1 Tax=Brachionus plicatilis TaxID=10195 RepID=A0A3M7REV9_BRAPC|nr:hypothetical protein BpHYR1_032987 [Brachionus plicatilis]